MADPRIDQARAERNQTKKERDAWREEAWKCYCASGADPDGDDARHLNPGEALAAVRQLREDEDEVCEENKKLQAQHDSLYLAVQEEVDRLRDGGSRLNMQLARHRAGTVAHSAARAEQCTLYEAANRLQAILEAAGEKREVPDYGELISAARTSCTAAVEMVNARTGREVAAATRAFDDATDALAEALAAFDLSSEQKGPDQ